MFPTAILPTYVLSLLFQEILLHDDCFLFFCIYMNEK
jgi:hypothetical protein